MEHFREISNEFTVFYQECKGYWSHYQLLLRYILASGILNSVRDVIEHHKVICKALSWDGQFMWSSAFAFAISVFFIFSVVNI